MPNYVIFDQTVLYACIQTASMITFFIPSMNTKSSCFGIFFKVRNIHARRILTKIPFQGMKFMILPISNQNLMKKKSNATLYLIISIFVGGGGGGG